MGILTKVTQAYGIDGMAVTPEVTLKMSPDKLPELFTLMAEVVALSVCDENGDCLYDANKPEDIEEIEEIDGDTLQKLFEECANRNGLLERNFKEELKNSETTQN